MIENLRNPYPEMKWVILIELAIKQPVINTSHLIRPLFMPNFYFANLANMGIFYSREIRFRP